MGFLPPALDDIFHVAFQGVSGERYLMALEAYFDESGDGPLLFMAAFIATEAKWEGFRKEWLPFVNDCPVKIPYFHMTECLATGMSLRDSMFRNLTQAQRDGLATSAVEITKRWFDAGQIVSVNTCEFNRVIHPAMKKHWGDAYSFCCQICIDRLSVIPKVTELAQDTIYLFEQGGPKWKRADRQMHKIQLHPKLKTKFRYRNHLFLLKTEAAPLQTPDILANLAWKTFKDTGTLEGPLHPLLARLADDHENQPILWDHFSGDKLLRVMADSMSYNFGY